MGLAIRTSRDAASLTLNDLASLTGLTQSTLSRTELGERDVAFTEILAIAEAVNIDVEALRTLAETFEREGAAANMAEKKSAKVQLARDMNQLQRLAIESAIELRSLARKP